MGSAYQVPFQQATWDKLPTQGWSVPSSTRGNQLEQLLSVLCFSPLSTQGRSGKPWGWGLEGRAALEAGQQVKDMLALGPHSESQQEHPAGLPRCSEVFGGMYLRDSDSVVYRGNALISLHDNLHM